MRRQCGAVLALSFFTVVPVFGQVQGGTVGGTVQDEQGGVLPGATVAIRGAEAPQTFTAEPDGRYRFLNVAPGTYTVTAALSGFVTIVRDSVVVTVGQTVELPFVLKIAAIAETITITAASPIVDPRATGTATNITSAELTRIPNARDVFALMREVPGVLVDRVNVGGNETGQQSGIASKGTRPQDTVWTMDGVVITDMVSVGAAPTYFNFDNFDEIHVSTAGQSIQQPTGGLGVNLIVKRGTNAFHGRFRGYFDNDAMESTNVPAELSRLAVPVTAATADHTKQLYDAGFEIGGPIVRDRAWLYGSYSKQDIRLVRQAGNLVDHTVINNPNLKVNWQVGRRDMLSFLYYNGDKVKNGRSPGDPGISIDAPGATYSQHNAYPEGRPHGLIKIADDHTFSSNLFVSGRYAYFGNGFISDPAGGLDGQAGQSVRLAQSFGTTRRNVNLRPQTSASADADVFVRALGAAHDVKFGFGWRRTDAHVETTWPGNGILARDLTPALQRARVFRRANGTNRTAYLDFYVGDSISRGPVLIDVGVRYDRQNGRAMPSEIAGNPAFPNLVPGTTFAGYDSPFTWNNVSPRAGLTYALDADRKTVARASVSRFAGQLNTGTVGFANLTTSAGYAEYAWTDLNGDHFASANELLDTSRPLSQGGGFNPADPSSVISANIVDPNLKAPITTTVVVGIDRELMPHLALRANYTHTRTARLVGSASNTYTRFVGLTTADYSVTGALTGTLPDGSGYNIPIYSPNDAKVLANGSRRMLTNWPDYSSRYDGIEVSAVKRLSSRWMARVGFALNSATDRFDGTPLDTFGNPTRTESEPLVDGGQLTAQASADVFMNAKWQFSANAAYELPWAVLVAGNVFGRQGYPFVLVRSASFGRDPGANVPVAAAVDSFRLPDLWNADARVSKAFGTGARGVRLIFDAFNVFNANTALARVRNLDAPSFNQLTQNLSPRIFRVGAVIGF